MFFFRFFLGIVLGAGLIATGGALHSARAVAKSQRWQLVWSDEFDNAGQLDPSKWEHEIDGGVWGNGEIQHYTDSPNNSYVEDGKLVIETRHEADGSYTSARLHAITLFTYGRFEIRAKFPSGNGIWPALWMIGASGLYGNGGWPDNGEVDIVEHVGREPDQLLASVYTKNFNWMNGNGFTNWINYPGTEEDFHIYTLEWDPEFLRISVDGKPYNVVKNPHTTWEDWPFDNNMRLMINTALASFGGDVDDAIFPQRMYVDYVRVYQQVP